MSSLNTQYYDNGDISHYRNNEYHCEDEPAIQWLISEEWWVNGKHYKDPKEMPLSLFFAFIKWELNNGLT